MGQVGSIPMCSRHGFCGGPLPESSSYSETRNHAAALLHFSTLRRLCMQDYQPANLRPYGNAASATHGTVAHDAVLQRAAYKLQQARAGALPKAGLDVRNAIVCVLLAVIIGGFFLLIGAVINSGNNATPGPTMFFLALGVLFIGLFLFLGFRPSLNSPKAALKSFIRMVSRGNYARAQRIIVQPDLDDFPRVQPFIVKLGQPTGVQHQFALDTSFREYWKGLLRWRPPCYCLAQVKGVRVTDIQRDVALVEAEVKFMMNTSLWLFLLPLGLLIVVIIDIATRTTVTVPLRKVVINVKGEWRIFNGELMGADEHDLRWLDANA